LAELAHVVLSEHAVPMALLKNFLLTGLLILVLATGCAGTQSLVESRFAALHGCRAETVTAVAGGGWIATGCGVRAHFNCFDTDDDHHHDEDTPIAGRILGAMLFSGLDSDDVCIQEQVDSGPEYAQPRDPTEVWTGDDGAVRLRADVPLMDTPRGQVRFVGLPTWRDPAVAARVTLQLESPLAATCPAKLWIDGVSSPVLPSVRNGDSTVTVALEAEQLAALARAQHASLDICGWVANLDAGSRARVRLFAGRFADARARLLPAAEAERQRAAAK
jgi:hypothetical protein